MNFQIILNEIYDESLALPSNGSIATTIPEIGIYALEFLTTKTGLSNF